MHSPKRVNKSPVKIPEFRQLNDRFNNDCKVRCTLQELLYTYFDLQFSDIPNLDELIQHTKKIINKPYREKEDILKSISMFLFGKDIAKAHLYSLNDYLTEINNYKSSVEREKVTMSIKAMNTFQDQLPEDITNYMKQYIPIKNNNNDMSYALLESDSTSSSY